MIIHCVVTEETDIKVYIGFYEVVVVVVFVVFYCIYDGWVDGPPSSMFCLCGIVVDDRKT